MGCFQGDFQEGKLPIKASGKQPIEVGKLPIKEGKRPINADGLFSGTPPWCETAPIKRPIQRSMNPIAKHLSRDPCRAVFSAVSQTTAATLPLLSVKKAYRNPKTGLGEGASQKKLASQACRAKGGIAWSSIANRALVGRTVVGYISIIGSGRGTEEKIT